MEEQMYILVAKVLNDEATGAERLAVKQWQEAEGANMSVYAEMERAWKQADLLLQGPAFDHLAAWEKVAAQTVNIVPAVEKKPVAFRKWFRISAAAALLAVIFIVYNTWNKEKMLLITATDRNLVAELPDHSKVYLQPGSTLSYPEQFSGDQRGVTLTGDAFFEVTRNEKKAFVVTAELIKVQVLGTSFYVAGSDSFASVTVATGKVEVTVAAHPEKKVTLTPGEKSLYDLQELKVTNDTNAYYYRTGSLEFSGRPMDEVLQEIAKVKNVTIQWDESTPLAKRKQLIYISFRNESTEDMLTALGLLTRSTWSRKQNSYIILLK
jgi:transmembrane sensor